MGREGARGEGYRFYEKLEKMRKSRGFGGKRVVFLKNGVLVGF